MKVTRCLAGILVVGAIGTAVGATPPPPQKEEVSGTMLSRPVKAVPLTLGQAKPNQILGRDVVFEGIAVQAVKAPKKLQLINPLAKEEVGRAEDNVVFDAVTGKSSGLKLFAIRF